MTPEDIANMLKDAVQGMEAPATKDPRKNSILVMCMTDGKLTVGVAGMQPELIKLVARAAASAPSMHNILKTALVIAPILNKLDDDTPCDCANCIERRAAEAAKDLL